MAAEQSQPAASSTPRPRHRRRRRLLVRLFFVCLALLLLIAAFAVVVTMVLRSDIPRQMILTQLHQRTGLRVEAGSVTTNWSGETVIEDLQLAPPLDSDPLLAADRVKVRHNPLLMLIFGRPVSVDSVEVVGKARIRLERNADGQWNAQRALDTLMQAAAKDDKGGPAPKLPRIEVQQAQLDAVDADGNVLLTSPLNASLSPYAMGAYELSVELPNLLQVKGRLSPPQQYTHVLRIESPDLTPLLALLPAQPEADLGPAVFRGDWRGRVADGALSGTLKVEEASFATVTAAGDMGIAVVDGAVEISPQSLVAQHINNPGIGGELVGGTLRVGPKQVVANAVRLRAFQHLATINAAWRPADRTGAFDVSYRGEVAGIIPEHQGAIAGTVQLPQVGQRRLAMEITSTGESALGPWQAAGAANVSGESWDQLTGQIAFAELSLQQGTRTFAFPGLAAKLALDWPTLSLERLTLPQVETSTATARVDLETQQWSVDIQASNWQPPSLQQPLASLVIRGHGEPGLVEDAFILVETAGATAELAGSYHADREDALQATVDARWPVNGEPVTVEDGALEGLAITQGRARARIDGSVRPLRLTVTADTALSGLSFEGRPVDDLVAAWSGHVNNKRAAAKSKPVDWLGASWQLAGEYGFEQGLIQLAAICEEMELAQLVDVLGIDEPVAGKAKVRLRADLPDLTQMPTRIVGDWQVRDLRLGQLQGEVGSGEILMQGKVLMLERVTLTQGEGQFRGLMRIDMSERPTARAIGVLQQFPLNLPGYELAMVLNGETDVSYRLDDRIALGRLSLRSDINWRQHDAGQIDIEGQFDGRSIVIDRIEGQTLGGSVEGQGRIDLDHLLQSAAELRFEQVDAGVLAMLLRIPVEEVGGQLTGSFWAGEPTGSRPLEPLELRLNLERGGVTWRAAELGQVNLKAFYGPERIVLDEGDINLLGGNLSLWAQVTPARPWMQVQFKLDGVRLEQLEALVTGDGELAGRLDGRGMLAGNPYQPLTAFGNANMRLSESDLIGFAPLRLLYQLTNRSSGSEPEGEGNVAVRFEAGRLLMTRLDYFNRGMEIIGQGAIEDLTLGLQSPVTGTFAGSGKPFRDLGLPGARTLDQFLSLVQGSVIAVVVEGKLGDYEVREVLLPELGDNLRRLLMSER